MTDLFGVVGNATFDGLELPDGYAHRIGSLRELIAVYTGEIDTLAGMNSGELDDHDGYWAIQAT